MRIKIRLLILTLAIGVAQACGNTDLIAAPIGDKKALEKLSASYTKLTEEMLTGPKNLNPQGQKLFLEKIFTDSGYSYSATLHALAEKGQDKSNQHVKDLAELMLMPHSGTAAPEKLSDLYNEQELMDIRKIEQQLK